MELSEYDDAMKHLNIIKETDPFCPEMYALMANLLEGKRHGTEIGNLYKKAYELTIDDFDVAYNYCSCLADIGDYRGCFKVLNNIRMENISSEQMDDYILLKAEMLLNSKGAEHAIEFLENNKENIENQENIQKNIKKIQEIIKEKVVIV